ncbi:porin [Acidovorax sp. Root217]|uniref:porin n=1 Tax=Acidovorax sp. Root217 TaxID=1736492 RepID=UPI000709398C|nr:porin [Acidovorax sp. Root217]KRC23212.1 porin [Acidovorax sp. Root217]
MNPPKPSARKASHVHPARTTPSFLRLAGVTCLAACALGSAHAQSGVTIFGTLDLNVTHAKAGGASVTSMSSGGNLVPSRLGFRGKEDLGGGLAAHFWLEAQLLPDSGALEGSALFHRRSTVSLSSTTWGEVRLGRDYAPTFWNVSQFAPFGTVGVGGSANIIEGWPFGTGGARTFVRSANSLGYLLPRNLGGVYGQAMVAAAEGADGARYAGARLGYASGPVDVAVAYGETPAKGQTSKVANIGGSYNFGMVKLMGYWLDQRAQGTKHANWLLGATVPVGEVGTVRLSVAEAKARGAAVAGDGARQIAVGYVHALSKRTALYGAYSRIQNRGNAAFMTSEAPEAAPGGNASGLQFGISHNF